MKAMVRVAIAAGLVTVAAATAQARTLYWTGNASVNNYYSYNPTYDCKAVAAADGEYGARQSCKNDYYINPSVCDSAPIQRTEDLGAWNDGYGNTSCQMRVFITVP